MCYVPLELIPFLPDGQPLQLPAEEVFSRADLLDRYDMVLRYHDVLARRLRHRPQYRYGLQALKDFAANPQAAVKSKAEASQDVVAFSVEGTFLPFEEVWVRLVTRTGQSVGPVKLAGTPNAVPANLSSREQLIGQLRLLRQRSTTTYTGYLALPIHTARSEVARFELTRQVHAYTYTGTVTVDITGLAALLGKEPDPFQVLFGKESDAHKVIKQTMTITLSPAELDQLIGGPVVQEIKATLQGDNVTLADESAARPMAASLPIPALGVAPTLSYADLLSIEAVFQHVVRNTVAYSKAVWMSLTGEERAILLERFTIGVPAGGAVDDSQQVPLLNCVANQVLGYFGNAMIMPFHIPPGLAARLNTTTRDVQEALLRFHRQAFLPANSSITLPTRGVLGEAVLGGCSSCEKIDLTRFWNWKDSPHDSAALPTSDAFSGRALIGPEGARAPESLSQLTSPINVVNNVSPGAGGTAGSSPLLEQMLKQAPAASTPLDITGLSQLHETVRAAAGQSRGAHDKALEASRAMAESAMTALTELAKTAAKVFTGGVA